MSTRQRSSSRTTRGPRTWLLRGTGVLSILLLSLVPGLPAHGLESAELGMRDTGYYTNTEDPLTVIGGIYFEMCQEPAFPLPDACLDPSSVTGTTPGWPRQDNYVYVARLGDEDDAYGYAAVDLFAIPFGSTLRSLEYRFQVEADQDSGTFVIESSNPEFDAEQPHIHLCLVTSDWVGVDGGPWEHRPNHDCGTSVDIELVSDEQRVEPDPLTDEERELRIVTYRADLMPMAAHWTNGENHGLAFIPTDTAPANWQVAIRTPFIAEDAMVALVTYDPPPPVPTPDFGALPTFRDDTGFSEQIIPGTPATTGFTVETPEAPEPTRVTRTRVPESDPRTPWWVWLVFPVGAGTLGVLSHGLNAPVPVTSERSGPVSRLMGRRTGSGG